MYRIPDFPSYTTVSVDDRGREPSLLTKDPGYRPLRDSIRETSTNVN